MIYKSDKNGVVRRGEKSIQLPDMSSSVTTATQWTRRT